jgi:hypothetical protein
MANTHENLEHAEHAEHNAHDPFNQRVAVSMAIVAAVLAAISMVGHRTHNKVLQLQGESNRLLGDVNRTIGEANRTSTEAASAEVEKSNLYAWYQAKKNRQTQYETSAALLEFSPGPGTAASKDADPESKSKIVTDWKKRAADYYKSNEKKDNLPDLDERGKEAGDRAKTLRAEAVEKRKEADTFRKQAIEKTAEADHVHHQTNRLDIAHLLAEMALVLCSIALLTKKKAFWFTGLGAAGLALALTLSAYTLSHHEPEAHEPPSSAAPDEKGKTN